MGYENHWLKVRQTLGLAMRAEHGAHGRHDHRRAGARGRRARVSRWRIGIFLGAYLATRPAGEALRSKNSPTTTPTSSLRRSARSERAAKCSCFAIGW